MYIVYDVSCFASLNMFELPNEFSKVFWNSLLDVTLEAFNLKQNIFTGLHGWNCLRQVHQADKQGGDDSFQQQRSRDAEERQLLSPLQDWRYEVCIRLLIV